MFSRMSRVVNLFDTEVAPPMKDMPEGHRFAGLSLSEHLGAKVTGLSVYELPPGEACWPYHFELNEEEWLVVVFGEVVVRTPRGEETLRAGDVVCFPIGADGAHAVRNESDAPARFAMPSCIGRGGFVAVYPDSNKLFVTGPGFSKRMFVGDEVEYWAGES
jgi:uncharacterized cupin superfamily protein